jgi:hypothetical protein
MQVAIHIRRDQCQRQWNVYTVMSRDLRNHGSRRFRREARTRSAGISRRGVEQSILNPSVFFEFIYVVSLRIRKGKRRRLASAPMLIFL